MYEAEVGDQVKFVADFDKPGWPRVDAGTVGEVREVSPESGQLAVNVTGVERTAGDAVVVSRQTIPVPADAVVLMLHDEDARRA